MIQPNTESLRFMLSTLPHTDDAAVLALRNVCVSLTEQASAVGLLAAKATLNDVAKMRLLPLAARPVYLTARRALVEQRAVMPRNTQGETPAYFRCLARREDSLCELLAGPLPSMVAEVHHLRASAYHALAAIHRFTQPQAAEPATVARSRKLLDQIMASPALASLSDELRTELQTDYDESLYL